MFWGFFSSLFVNLTRNPPWLCCEPSPSCSCFFQLSQWLVIQHPALWIGGPPGASDAAEPGCGEPMGAAPLAAGQAVLLPVGNCVSILSAVCAPRVCCCARSDSSAFPQLCSHYLFMPLFALLLGLRLLFSPLGAFTGTKFQFCRIL